MLRCRVLILALDGGLAVWSERDYTDRNSEVVLHELDIVLEFLRELAFLADFRQVFLPAWELGVDGSISAAMSNGTWSVSAPSTL